MGDSGRNRGCRVPRPATKALTGLDQHQVRRWTSWRRWTLLAMLAYALLTVLAATERAENSTPQGTSLITLTCNEIHRLSTPSSPNRYTTCDTDCAGRSGDDNTNTAPESATTTVDKPSQHDDHELRTVCECWKRSAYAGRSAGQHRRPLGSV